MNSDNVARIIHITALSQLLVELIEDSVYDEIYKSVIRTSAEKFIKVLDKKLNYMLNEDESAEQVLNYTTIVQNELKEWSDGIELELKKIMK
jgi:hypothetical protein